MIRPSTAGQIAGIPVKQAELLTANFRDSLKKNYGLISHDLDARFNSNNTKVDSLNKNEELIIKFDQISQLKNEINTILNNATANSADLDLAQQKIDTLRQKAEELRNDKTILEEQKRK